MYNPKIIETLTDRITRDMKSGVRAKIEKNKKAATYKTFSSLVENREVAIAYFDKYVIPVFGRKNTPFREYIRQAAKKGHFLTFDEQIFLIGLFGADRLLLLQNTIELPVLGVDMHFKNNEALRETLANESGDITRYYVYKNGTKTLDTTNQAEFVDEINSVRGSNPTLQVDSVYDEVTGLYQIYAFFENL